MRVVRVLLMASLIAPVIARADGPSATPPDAEERFSPGHDWEGLPAHAGPFRMYARDPESPLNHLHQLLFVNELIAKEVAGALPAERRGAGGKDADDFPGKWYFEKRPGEERDRRLFGGDVRVSPLISWKPENTPRLLAILETLATPTQVADNPALKNPYARLLLQWDLLSVWWRLEQQKETPAEVLTAMARSIRALGLPRETLMGLASGGSELRRQFSGGDAGDQLRPFLPMDFLNEAGEPTWTELDRRSTRLFHAETQMRASRVFLSLPQKDVEQLLAGKSSLPEAPPPRDRPIVTALILTLMAIDDRGEAVATPVIDELRIRAALAPEVEKGGAPTSSRDGSSHWIYFRSRRQSLVDRGEGDFRFVADTNQSLFLEYGSAKHTTYFAQCALCHRLQGTGNQAPLGIRTLSKQAAARIATAPELRFRLAEQELKGVAERLTQRLKAPAH